MLKRLLFLASVFSLNACSGIAYYSQSIGGQMEIFLEQQDIAELLEDDRTTPDLKQKLQLVMDIRDYSVSRLKLPDNDSYRSYADLQRDHVVWNVFAAGEFSLQLRQWCFPFAGCVGYKGWFARDDALAFASELKALNLDTYTGGVDAYSTLGWFDDPILSTVINRSEPHLAGLIFHELAHQQVYVKGDTAFNESFASTVEIEGVRLWLQGRQEKQLIQEYEQYKARRRQFLTLVDDTRARLSDIYAGEIPVDVKRRQKQLIIEEMRSAYQELKTSWQGYAGYDRWFEGEINNARLASVAVYADWVPAFQALLRETGNDFSAFYDKVGALAKLEPAERQAALAELSRKATTGSSARIGISSPEQVAR